MLLGAVSGLYAVSHVEVLVGGGALVIVCSVMAVDPALKELSKGVEWSICWLWEKYSRVLIVRIWVGGGGNSGLVGGELICGLVTVLLGCCIPDSCNQQLWSVLVCSHMPGSSIRASTEWGRFPSSYDRTTLRRIRKTSNEVLRSRFP